MQNAVSSGEKMEGTVHGRRRRKNLAGFVAGTVIDLLVPSSVMGEVFGSQVVGGVRAADCSKLKSAVLADGQERVRSVVDGSIERTGRGGR